MTKKRHTPEQIVALLRQVEVTVANGNSTPQACKEAAITEQTYYRWRKEYRGLCCYRSVSRGDGKGATLGASPRLIRPFRLKANIPPQSDLTEHSLQTSAYSFFQSEMDCRQYGQTASDTVQS